ncbi:MAG: MarR family transcriptional regulator [Oscillospiraceae bacterium]|nr:MarR family transcriptional regulator [Oscillospiraceae bacterium]
MISERSQELKRFIYLFFETEAVYHKINVKMGISDSVLSILYVILHNGDRRSLQEICRYAGLSKQTVHSAIQKMETLGLIDLEMVNAKSKMVCLTKAGADLARRTAGQVMEIENSIFASWPREDVEKYLELAERFLLALNEKAESIQKGETI